MTRDELVEDLKTQYYAGLGRLSAILRNNVRPRPAAVNVTVEKIRTCKAMINALCPENLQPTIVEVQGYEIQKEGTQAKELSSTPRALPACCGPSEERPKASE